VLEGACRDGKGKGGGCVRESVFIYLAFRGGGKEGMRGERRGKVYGDGTLGREWWGNGGCMHRIDFPA